MGGGGSCSDKGIGPELQSTCDIIIIINITISALYLLLEGVTSR